MNFFDRCWQLKIHFLETGSVKIYQKLKREDVGLALSFNCRISTNSSPAGGEFTVSNLTPSDLAYLGASFQPGITQLKPAEVEFSAGYDGELSLIMLGNVFRTNLNYTSPDRSVSMSIMNGIQKNQMNRFASVSMQENTTLRDIVANLANKMSLALDIDPKLTNIVVGDYSFQGSPNQQLSSLRSQHPDVIFTIDKKKLMVHPKKAPQGAVRYKISASSGLLGTPQPQPSGVIITTYLLSKLSVHDYIELESARLPQLNRVYRVMGIEHRGDSRSGTWQSILTCVYPEF